MHQHCHRCGARHPVRAAPAAWCPRCGGVLSAPTDRPAAVRWVARTPPRATPPRRPRPAPGPTPRYAATPRWGLRDVPPGHPLTRAEAGAPSTAERAVALAATLQVLLVTTAAAALLAALAEAWRYGLALQGRTELLGARTVALSDSAVVAAGLLAPVFALSAGALGALWLLRARAAAAERAGVRETRPGWQVVLGVVLPVVNLVLPAVWLAELEHRLDRRPAQDRPRPSRLLRAWWASWVLSEVLLGVGIAWRFRGSAQARADSIVLAGVSDLVAAGCAVLTILLLRRFTTALGGLPRRAGRAPRRWVASVPSRAASTPADRAADDPEAAGPGDEADAAAPSGPGGDAAAPSGPGGDAAERPEPVTAGPARS